MVVIVVLRSRGMRTPTNCYLVSLAIADSMVLVASVPNEIIAYYMLGDKWLWGSAGCAIFIFLQYLGINASSLSIAAFTVERYIAICHPMRAHKLCTVRRAKRIILYVWMFATTYCAPWIFLTKTAQIHYIGVESEVYTCKFALNREYYKGYFLTDIVLFYILPLLMSCVLYALIARILYNKDILRREKSSNTTVMTSGGNLSRSVATSTTTTTTAKTTSSILIENHTNTSNDFPSPHQLNQPATNIAQSTSKINLTSTQPKKNMSSSDASRVQVVKMLAVVVAVFATLWLPYRALVVYNSFTFPPYMELWYLMFAKTMIFVNSAINPIIYSACSIKFRREFKRMLTCTGANNYYYWSHRTGGNGTVFSGTTNADITISDGKNQMFRATPQRSRLNSLQSMDSSIPLQPSNHQLQHQLTVDGMTVRRDGNYLSPVHALIGYKSSTTARTTTTTTTLPKPITPPSAVVAATIVNTDNNQNGCIAIRTSKSNNGAGTNAVIATIIEPRFATHSNLQNRETTTINANNENNHQTTNSSISSHNGNPLNKIVRQETGSGDNLNGSDLGSGSGGEERQNSQALIMSSNSTINLSPSNSTATIIKTTTSITLITSDQQNNCANQNINNNNSTSNSKKTSSSSRKKKCNSEEIIRTETILASTSSDQSTNQLTKQYDS